LLCERLWSGLRSESLRTNTWHKLDSADDYDTFLRGVRQVEKELSLSNPKVKGHSSSQSSLAVSAPVTISPPVDLFQKEMDDLEQRLNNRISSVQSGVDKKFSAILQRLDSFSMAPSQASGLCPLPDLSQPPPLFSQNQSGGQPRRWKGEARRYLRQRSNQQSGNHPNF